jgi:hypothetical protein
MEKEKCVRGTVRKLQKQANGSTTVALPVELVRAVAWRDKQKVVVQRRGNTLVVKEWKGKR